MKSLLRRPSTWILVGAGLLTADQLRSSVGSWTDAALFACVALTLVFAFALRSRSRSAHRREVEITALPLSSAIEPEGRRRAFWFVLFLAALIVVPVAFAVATK